jgi:hypothetical protein
MAAGAEEMDGANDDAAEGNSSGKVNAAVI